MKKLVAFLAFLAFPAWAGDFPDFMGTGRNGLIPSSYEGFIGKRLDPPQTSDYTTLDAVDFGRTVKAVRLCYGIAVANTTPIYIRAGTTVTNVTASLDAIRAPSSTSAAFISGAAGTFHAGGAWVVNRVNPTPDREQSCVTVPLNVRGIVMHIASGVATLDVTGFY